VATCARESGAAATRGRRGGRGVRERGGRGIAASYGCALLRVDGGGSMTDGQNGKVLIFRSVENFERENTNVLY
jgi:hypothetical protein